MLNIIICDDNSKTIDILDMWIKSLVLDKEYLDIRLVLKATQPQKIIDYVNTSTASNMFYVFLLDVDLKNSINGIMLAEHIKKKLTHAKVIFITAHSHLGMEVVNKHIEPFAYLIKPLKEELFKLHLDSLYQYYLKTCTQNNDEVLSLSAFGRTYPINIHDIVYIEIDSSHEGYVIVHSINGDIQHHKSSLSKFMKELNSIVPTFIPTYKSYITNLKHITVVNTLDRTITLCTGQTINLSRDKAIQHQIEAYIANHHTTLY